MFVLSCFQGRKTLHQLMTESSFWTLSARKRILQLKANFHFSLLDSLNYLAELTQGDAKWHLNLSFSFTVLGIQIFFTLMWQNSQSA